jgi:cytochrome b involved in lipid metabolism
MEYTLKEVSLHHTVNYCWIIYNKNVYNITEYLNKHPGGKIILLNFGGEDITNEFELIQHSDNAYNILDKYKIGVIN